jgi:hypothetical protein
MIKQKCAWCNASIPNDKAWYSYHGNACSPCSVRFGKISDGVRGLRLDKNGNIQNYKVRELTFEERDKLLEERIIEIKKRNENRSNSET